MPFPIEGGGSVSEKGVVKGQGRQRVHSYLSAKEILQSGWLSTSPPSDEKDMVKHNLHTYLVYALNDQAAYTDGWLAAINKIASDAPGTTRRCALEDKT
jgi:hypothetical protein